MTSGWQSAGASVLGSAHRAAGTPCEDAWASAAIPAGGAAIAVADGHGSTRSPRAAVGARLAVDVVVALLADALRPSETPEQFSTRLAESVGPQLISEWQARVAQDAVSRPFDATERVAIGTDAPDEGLVRLAYGCTLVAAVANDTLLGAVQIGDGDFVFAFVDGGVARPLPQDAANVGNVTSSLAQADPGASLRIAVIDTSERPIALAFAATDGLGGAQADPDWWRLTAAQLGYRADRFGMAEVAARLPEWLADPAEVGGDDVTLAVLVGPTPWAGELAPAVETTLPGQVLTEPAAAATLLPPPMVPEPSFAPAGSPPPLAVPGFPADGRSRNRRALVIAAIVLALAAVGGVAAAVIASGGSDSKELPKATPRVDAPIQRTPTPEDATPAPAADSSGPEGKLDDGQDRDVTPPQTTPYEPPSKVTHLAPGESTPPDSLPSP